MKKLIIALCLVSLMSCGKHSSSDSTSNTIAKAAPTATAASLNPSVKFAGKSGMSLTGSHDGLIYGSAATAALMYQPDETNKFGYIDLGSSNPYYSASSGWSDCQYEPLNKGSQIEFCHSNVQYSDIASQTGVFSVDFLITSMSDIELVQNDTVYTTRHLTHLSALAGLPFVELDRMNESAVTIIFARNDWFPTAFTITDGTASITLTAHQQQIIDSMLQKKQFNCVILDGIITVVPMAVSQVTVPVVAVDPTISWGTVGTSGDTGPEVVKLNLAGSTIPIADAQFTVTFDLDQIASTDSDLSATPPTFKPTMINGVPWGVTMSVTKKADVAAAPASDTPASN